MDRNNPRINIVIANINAVSNLEITPDTLYYDVLVYDVANSNNPYNIEINNRNDAAVYLKYIVDNYDTLPILTYFIHNEEYSQYHSGNIIDKFEEALRNNSKFYNINDKYILCNITTQEYYNDMMIWYNTYIQDYIPLQENWTNECRVETQFLVHKDFITLFPKIFYENLYNWIITTNIDANMSAKYMENIWHLLWEIYPNIAT
jgi:hypothetical protein